MNSYILKKDSDDKEVLLYQEKISYSFTPKKENYIKKITILDKEMVSSMWEKKFAKEYNAFMKKLYFLLSSDETDEGAVLAAFTEEKRIKEYLFSLKLKGLSEEFVNKYSKKLYLLEAELKKISINKNVSKGKGR